MGNLPIPRVSGVGHSLAVAVTRSNTFAMLQAALVRTLTPRTDEEYLPGISAFVTERVREDIVLEGETLDGLWPAGQVAPWIWVLTPRPYGYLAQSRVDVWTDTEREDGAAVMELPYDVSERSFRGGVAAPVLRVVRCLSIFCARPLLAGGLSTGGGGAGGGCIGVSALGGAAGRLTSRSLV